MLCIHYSKYGNPRSDEMVLEYCKEVLRTWAKETPGEVWEDHICNFVILDVYRSLILQNPQYKDFVKFFIDGNEIIFDKYMISNDDSYNHLTDVWANALHQMTMLRMTMRKEEQKSKIPS